MLAALIRRFLYHPEPLPPGAPPPRWAAGSAEVYLPAGEGLRIHGLHWPAPPGRPTILFLHGNAQTVFEWALVAAELAPARCGLLLIDYPGYGKSTGEPREETLYAAGRGALAWLDETAGVPAGQVIAFGKSLGGGVATCLARDGALGGLVLESTFCSIPAVAQNLFPFLPRAVFPRSEVYDSLGRLAEIDTPVLVVHGTADTLIPVAQGERLYAAARGPKALYLVEGAGHNDVAPVAGPAYGARIAAWVDGLTLGA